MECVFCDFIFGKKNNHINFADPLKKYNYPLDILYENKKIFCFLSVPDYLGYSDILVISKQHAEFIEELSEEILTEIIAFSAKLCKILRKKYGGCKILNNNGEPGDQYVKHVHFHLIPKNEKKDNPWKNLTGEEFIKLSEELKKEIKVLL